MAVDGIKGVVQAAIQRASQATGVDFAFLMKTAGRESGLDPSAKAGTSSAAGLFQFVEQTWLSTLKQHGTKYGYGRYADLIDKGSDGKYHVSGDGRRAVMDLRLDPHAASLMAGELTSDHAAYLKGRVGRQPTAGELYAAHFLGPQGSAKLIQAAQSQPGVTAASLFPDAARANKAIFYRDGRAASVGEVYANLTKTGGAQAVETGPVEADKGQPAFIRYASARHADQQREEQMLIAMLLRGSGSGSESGSTSSLGSLLGEDAGKGAGSRLASSMFTTEMLKLMSGAADSSRDT
jgi:hypothetical protein